MTDKNGKSLFRMTALEIRDAVRSGKLSAVNIAGRFIERARRLDEKVEAVISFREKDAVKDAEKIDAAVKTGEDTGPLAGVPVMVKDNMQLLGTKTTAGSRILENYDSQFTATAIKKLRAAGAIIIAKTNLDEFAMGSSCEHSAFHPTRNPFDLERSPGGSSGGSATAVAARMVPVALGSDTGGSIRQPAAFCGVVGIKPTYGRVSRYGLLAYGSSLDQIGVFSTTVDDAALACSVISGHDPRDATSSPKPVPDYLADISGRQTGKKGGTGALAGLKIGRPKEYFGEGLDTEVRERVEDAFKHLEAAGAKIVEVSLPHSEYAVAAYYIIASSEASSNLARYDGVHYGYRTSDKTDLVGLYSRSRREALGAEVKRRIMLGTYALSSGYYDAYYKKAQEVRTLIRRDFDEAFGVCDIIAGPVSPTTAFKLGEKLDDPLQMYLSDIYTISVNLAALSGISIPCGFDSAGLPTGLQLIAPSFGETVLFRAAAAYQRRTEHHLIVPDVADD